MTRRESEHARRQLSVLEAEMLVERAKEVCRTSRALLARYHRYRGLFRCINCGALMDRPPPGSGLLVCELCRTVKLTISRSEPPPKL